MASFTMARVLAACLLSLQSSCQDLLRRDIIEASIAPSVQASLKNNFGRLDRRAATRVVQRFLAREHAWQVKAGSDIVKSAVLEVDRGGRGLSAGDIVKAIESIEQIVFETPPSPPSGQSVPGRCATLKASLVSISHLGTGRVPLNVFQAKFASEDFDEHDIANVLVRAGDTYPQLLIANYLSSSAFCLSSGSLESECCANECEHIMHDLELQLQAPIVAPDRLFESVRKVVSSRESGRWFSPHVMRMQLHAIAGQNDGDVPLHGEAFATWLHYAFPNECPLPRSSVSSVHTLEDVREENTLAADRNGIHANQGYTVDMMLAEYVADCLKTHGTLPLAAISSTVLALVRLAVMIFIGSAMLRTAVAYIKQASSRLHMSDMDDLSKQKPMDARSVVG